MISNIKIMCTIGPSSNNSEILEKFKARGVDFFRINLSHTEEGEMDEKIRDIIDYGIPVIIDTEGSQVRSGNTEKIIFNDGDIINLYGDSIKCDSKNIFLTPTGVVKRLKEGDLISIDFNSVLLRVFDTSSMPEGYLLCEVVIGGIIEGRKAVSIESPTFSLPSFSRKDYLAIELAKKHEIKHFSLSFMEDPETVLKFKKTYPEAIVYSKIESKKGVKNFLEIAKVSDGILIDRGDLSSQVSLEKIPFTQKFIIKKVRELGKEIFIATSTLEQMSMALKPSRAEINDIINTMLDGASGIALTKETAIGKYPIETVNMLSLLIKQIDFLNKKDGEDIINKIAESNYLESEETPGMLIKPHGGKLIDRFFPNYKGVIPEKKVEIDEETLMDIEQIAIGSFSPLDGFMKKDEVEAVASNMRLTNKTIWPLPITLKIDDNLSDNFRKNEDISLSKGGDVYAILSIEEVYSLDKKDIAQKVYGSVSMDHPGVKKFMEGGNTFLGGKITMIKRRKSQNKIHELTPRQTRKIFYEKGWSKIIGFHTRNVIHKSHEFIQLEGLKRSFCDGLFIHPVIGKKKNGDFESDIIIKTYEKMIKDFYPKGKIVFGSLATYSRYAGPREAVFTALIRKNFGCSHFIIGRDHTGVGSFYDPQASHKIFDNFTKEELGIEIIKFGRVFYSDLENKYIHEPDFIDYPEENKLHLSGTQAREMLLIGVQPPEWFMRPEISKIIIDKLKNNERVFVE